MKDLPATQKKKKKKRGTRTYNIALFVAIKRDINVS